MVGTNDIRITIDGKQFEYTSADDLPINITNQIEDLKDFQRKTGGVLPKLVLPATANNMLNTLSLDKNKSYPIIITIGGDDYFVGKAFKNGDEEINNRTTQIEFDCFDKNSEWAIDLKELTLYDVLKHIQFTFDDTTIRSSWVYDGMNELSPFVFAPIRYGKPFGGYRANADGDLDPVDDNVEKTYLKPSVSKYWAIYWGFKKAGYRIESTFMDSSYFRRQIMPWTWGSFLTSEGTRYEVHKFRAKSVSSQYLSGDQSRWWNLDVSNDSTNGMFDNNVSTANPLGDYTYSQLTATSKWQYNAPHYGTLEATFSFNAFIDMTLTGSSEGKLEAFWYKNGVQVATDLVIRDVAPTIGSVDTIENREFFRTFTVAPGDAIELRFRLDLDESKTGRANMRVSIDQFQIDYFRIPLGGQIDFSSYNGLKNYKWLDLLRGVCDEFNLDFDTDNITKVVKMDPLHEYSLTDNLAIKSGGAIDMSSTIDWTQKIDVSQKIKNIVYKDHEREVYMSYKEDFQDGVFKKVKDRHLVKLGESKYVFPERFKSGNKKYENRFFAATMHFDAVQFQAITGVAPQIPVIAPENISNTSASEADNTFTPRSLYYKGLVPAGWRFGAGRNAAGDYIGGIETLFPMSFAVNYQPGGQNDPSLSYSDERIPTTTPGSFTYAKGLFKRFFWQRFANMRGGDDKNAMMLLNAIDGKNGIPRKHVVLNGERYEARRISNYSPIKPRPTAVDFRKWQPILNEDLTATYPSISSVVNGVIISFDPFDMKYNELKCLTTDIPT